jgi:hypothetical protein
MKVSRTYSVPVAIFYAAFVAHYERGRRRLRGMSGINILGRLFLALRRHFGGIRFPQDSARPELIPLDIILGQARFAIVELSSRAVLQI